MEKNIKIFISYSWSTKEFIDWVRDDLATKLLNDGIEVILDQWDLKEGYDIYKFMESMVADETVDNVLVLCDKAYQEKANERRGGVGTETQIITPNVYADANQDKFIPIVVERDENGKDFIPIYMKGRKFIDFSSEELFIANYEHLLRTLYKRPQYRKPKKGNPPSYLFSEEEVNDYKFHFLLQQIKSDIFKQRTEAATYKINEFKNEFITSLNSFIIDKTGSAAEVAAVVEDKIDNSLILRNDYVEFIELVLLNNLIDVDFLIGFFEDLYNKYKEIKSNVSGTFYDIQFNHFQFLIRELFLYTVTVLINTERYETINKLINARYFLYREYVQNGKEGADFERFDCYLGSLEELQNKKFERKFYSYMAEKIVNRATINKLQKVDLAQTDTLLYYLSVLRTKESDRYWFPRLYVYLGYSKIELLQKIESRRHFDKVKALFGVNDIQELKELFFNFNNPYSQGYSHSFDNVPNISDYIEIEKIGKYS
ncbi:TIR domain-containing protein [Bacillus lacus]|uniref:TIR domain-containing protein n=1 Tax=Metabacillus lacus TaxID=1983721 RepID=A0A7X2J1L4_9BACI|nr:toll/interleukin-1 receptor domain-containing protein [Metabacillus lacus]MRX73644.1 TIR domain-containing protein [Metabacillus lacus]